MPERRNKVGPGGMVCLGELSTPSKRDQQGKMTGAMAYDREHQKICTVRSVTDTSQSRKYEVSGLQVGLVALAERGETLGK